MLRVPPASDNQITAEVRQMARDWEALGSDSTFVRTLGRRPEYFQDFMRFHLAVRNEGILDATLKELVRLKVANLNACRYWQGSRSALARAQGMTEEQVVALEDYEADPQFSSQQKVAFRLAEYMFYDPHHLPEDLAADLRRLFSEEELIELVWITGHFIGLGKVVLTLGMERASP